jgi:hypothetical protein
MITRPQSTRVNRWRKWETKAGLKAGLYAVS